MSIEIERKFLAHPAVLEHCRNGVRIVQGYLHTDAENTLRVRRMGERYFIAWKGKRRGAVREEIEQEVDSELGAAMLETISPRHRIEKVRHRIDIGGFTWEVDLFGGALGGLILAEVELTREDEDVPLPDWIGREVTTDERYRNSRLATLARKPVLIAA